ncbi:MAG: ABC transporter ATP-binding protein [Lachnospiraceae bacterium]|nr:ABC transporter ATP-binding protein [Lachnospiraceae bacterium]HCJ07245.1 ABC transporter ATP-binding protein [Lachnospiraceae bacterium]
MLTIENLTKQYGKFLALDHLNLHIDKGEIYGFVGPNGAGKTTTMRIVCGLLKATSGSVTVDGIDAIKQPDDIKRKVGYVPDFFGVYDNLKVMEYMEFYGSMYGMERQEIDDISEGLLELVNLSDKKDAFVDTLSRGMKQRLCVARALIHNPDLLVLDEPNSGLDPRARFEMKEVLKNLRSMGKTILISSHILPELSELCTSVGIMEHGRLVTSGKVDDIIDASQGNQPIHMKVVYAETEEPLNQYVATILKEQPFVEKVSFTDDEVLIHFRGDDLEAARLLNKLFDHHIMVSHYYREKENLESLFLEITGGEENA